jgi:hypothetical protein
MKVGDLVRPINPKSINHDKLIEVIEIEEGFLKRIRLKFHNRTTIGVAFYIHGKMTKIG